MPQGQMWCGRCGEQVADTGGDTMFDTGGGQAGGGAAGGGAAQAGAAHEDCASALALEPPRYCTSCRRRMRVQVVPGGWSAECVVHGTLEQSTWG